MNLIFFVTVTFCRELVNLATDCVTRNNLWTYGRNGTVLVWLFTACCDTWRNTWKVHVKVACDIVWLNIRSKWYSTSRICPSIPLTINATQADDTGIRPYHMPTTLVLEVFWSELSRLAHSLSILCTLAWGSRNWDKYLTLLKPRRRIWRERNACNKSASYSLQW
jgi:hypothetical protein